MRFTLPDSVFERAVSFFLLATMLVYAFSVAATNTFLFCLVALTIIKSDMIRHGIKVCWHDYRGITAGILSFAALTLIGSLWSEFTDWTIRYNLKQFKWLIIPAIIGAVYYFPDIRKKAFIFVSVGLSLHLLASTAQAFKLLKIDQLGSKFYDPAGYLGHISFGFVYGIWIGVLLIVASKVSQKKWAVICYLLAAYTLVMVFLTHGRSGQVTTITILLLVFLKALFQGKAKQKIIMLGLFALSLTLLFNYHQISKSKLKQTTRGIEAYFEGDWRHTAPRIKIWVAAIEMWKESPWFGIGTGDYKKEYKKILSNPENKHLKQHVFASSHNEFIFNLVRWGPLGLIVTIYLCWMWIRTGWKKDWKRDTMNAYLCTASGLSIVIHGLTEVSLNHHMVTTFATIVLAFSMTKASPEEEQMFSEPADS